MSRRLIKPHYRCVWYRRCSFHNKRWFRVMTKIDDGATEMEPASVIRTLKEDGLTLAAQRSDCFVSSKNFNCIIYSGLFILTTKFYCVPMIDEGSSLASETRGLLTMPANYKPPWTCPVVTGSEKYDSAQVRNGIKFLIEAHTIRITGPRVNVSCKHKYRIGILNLVFFDCGNLVFLYYIP